MRMKRDTDEYDDYCGTAVECVELVDAPNRSKGHHSVVRL